MDGRMDAQLCAEQGDVASQHRCGLWLLAAFLVQGSYWCMSELFPCSCSSTFFLVLFLLRGGVWVHLTLPQDFSSPPDVLSCTPRVQAAFESPTLHPLLGLVSLPCP